MVRRVAGLLLLAAGTFASDSPVADIQQKFNWPWNDTPSWKDLVDKAKEKKNSVMSGIDDYKKSAKDYANAAKDNAFKKAVAATGICEVLPQAESDSSSDIEDQLATDLSEEKGGPSVDSEECEATADAAAAENLDENLKKDYGAIADKLMKILISRTSGSLCEGDKGVRDWLEKNSGLRDTDPQKYKEELKKKLKGKVGATLGKYTKVFCPAEESRLFTIRDGPLFSSAAGAGIGSLMVLVVLGSLAVGFAVVAVRRVARQPTPQESELLTRAEECPEA